VKSLAELALGTSSSDSDSEDEEDEDADENNGVTSSPKRKASFSKNHGRHQPANTNSSNMDEKDATNNIKEDPDVMRMLEDRQALRQAFNLNGFNFNQSVVDSQGQVKLPRLYGISH
jgi:hypothetical protein